MWEWRRGWKQQNADFAGNLCEEPQTRQLKSGDRVAGLRIATRERWRDKATGERREKTQWHRVTIYNPGLGRVATQYLHKGSSVYIEGRLEGRRWQDASGRGHFTTEVVFGRFDGEPSQMGMRSSRPSRDAADRTGEAAH